MGNIFKVGFIKILIKLKDNFMLFQRLESGIKIILEKINKTNNKGSFILQNYLNQKHFSKLNNINLEQTLKLALK